MLHMHKINQIFSHTFHRYTVLLILHPNICLLVQFNNLKEDSLYQSYSCACVSLGCQSRSTDLQSLVAILNHGAGWKQQRQCHKYRLASVCSMDSSVDLRGDSKFETYTYMCQPVLGDSACTWQLSLNEEERLHLSAIVVGNDCDSCSKTFCCSCSNTNELLHRLIIG